MYILIYLFRYMLTIISKREARAHQSCDYKSKISKYTSHLFNCCSFGLLNDYLPHDQQQEYDHTMLLLRVYTEIQIKWTLS